LTVRHVELRSDTFTTPTPEMRRAMADAEVGDDEYGEDPTVNRLQSLAAGLLGTEAALYVPSGTMANQLAIRVLSRPGTEVLCPARSHVHQYELAASPQNSGVQLHPLWDVPDGITAAIEGSRDEFPPVSMLVLENTYMAMSGAPTGVDETQALVQRARAGHLDVHVDGARIWNAAVATGVSPADLCAGADTMMFCLSKGLGAPVGSLLCGSRDHIERARVMRHRLGGGMRQAGVLAAAGIVAVETMVDRLTDDHVRARRFADALATRFPDAIDPDHVETNIVCATKAALPDGFVEQLEARGIRAGLIDAQTVRFVTHKDVDDDGLERAIAALDELARAA